MTDTTKTNSTTQDDSDWRILVELFERISALPEGERMAQVDSLDLSDALREDLEKMLSTLNRTVSWVDMPLSSRIQLDQQWNAHQWIGKQLDGFTLNELLHEGVISAVFRATQSSPVQREVIIKLVRPDAPKQYLDLFRFEQQALAKQTHPNIVTVHKLGKSANGVTYIVMEFIEGLVLSEYCDVNQLTIPERLKLFLSICEAVNYSHQKGILHRDLKSSNVLVRGFDGKHSPTIIDYGISTELEEILDRPQGQLLGTPEYMSPEHVLEPNDLDSRADIYSLGMVLFNLLIGRIPFDRTAISNGDRADIVASIMRFEVLAPSRYFEGLEPAEQLSAATHRGSNVSSLRWHLGDELDSIFVKATQKNKEIRYQSVSEFATDIRHYLASEEVTAHPNTLWYKSRKFLWRNLTASAAMLLVIGLASAFMIKLVDQNIRIKEEISQTQLQRQNAEQVASILAETIGFANPSSKASTGKASVKGMLEYGYRNLENTLGIAPNVKAELMLAFSSGFRGVGDIDKAKQIQNSMLNNPAVDDPETIVQTYLSMARTANLQADATTELDYAKKAYDYAVDESLGGKSLASGKLALGKAHMAVGEWKTASVHLSEALSIYQSESLNDDQFLSEIVFASGKVAYWRDQYEQADALYKQARDTVSKYYSDEHPRVMQIELAEIGLANHLQKYEESIPRSEQLYKRAVKLWGADSHDAFAILTELTISYMQNEKYAKAAETAVKNLLALETLEEVPGGRTVFTLTLLSNIYFYDEIYDKSFDASKRAYELVKQKNKEGPEFTLWRIAETELVHARALAMIGELEAALSVYSSGIKVFSKDESRSNDFLSSALTGRAMVYSQLNSFEEAYKDASQGVDIAKLAYPEEDQRIGIAKTVQLHTGLLVNWSDQKFIELKQAWNDYLENSREANTPQFKNIGQFIASKE